MTRASTRLLGLLGHPVAHSRSPAIHTAALEALGADAVYLAFDVAPEALADAVGGLRALGVLGLNVTVPHKQRIVGLLDEVDAAAGRIGAVNCVWVEGGRWIGTNTDAPGLARSLEDASVTLDGRAPLVLGAGGAARASVVGLADAGCAPGVVAARRLEAAREVARLADGWRAIALRNAGALRAEAARAGLLVQATSATMGEGAEAFAAALPIDALPDAAAVVDLVYAPLETAVLAAARARGLTCVDGLGMLVWQAALALERWLGERPPIEALREAATLTR